LHRGIAAAEFRVVANLCGASGDNLRESVDFKRRSSESFFLEKNYSALRLDGVMRGNSSMAF
jgi:hypothetical protein